MKNPVTPTSQHEKSWASRRNLCERHLFRTARGFPIGHDASSHTESVERDVADYSPRGYTLRTEISHFRMVGVTRLPPCHPAPPTRLPLSALSVPLEWPALSEATFETAVCRIRFSRRHYWPLRFHQRFGLFSSRSVVRLRHALWMEMTGSS